MPRNVFVFGLDDHHLAQLKALRRAAEYRFLPLFSRAEVKAVPEIPVERLLAGARKRLREFQCPVDAIIGYWDFPVSTMLPLLREPLGLPSPSFEAVLKCEHKYWSRVEQARVVGEHIPAFCAVDPFAEDVRGQIGLDYPFWIKPVKSVLSHLGFMVRNRGEFELAVDRIRQGIQRFARPFNYLLQFVRLPTEIASVDGWHCIAESIISRGRQCTLEGYVQGGCTVIYGAVDSVRDVSHRSSFTRYQYPSRIPRAVRARMAAIVGRFLYHIGYDDGPFNVEFFWERSQDRISLLEINTRISKSHSAMFKMVDGEYHHQVALDLAMGIAPRPPHRQGRYRTAAKFMWRHFEDARVSHVPSGAEMAEFCRKLPGTEIELHVSEGGRLSELPDQDSYSYEVAVIHLGADSQSALHQRYRQCQAAMHLQLDPL